MSTLDLGLGTPPKSELDDEDDGALASARPDSSDIDPAQHVDADELKEVSVTTSVVHRAPLPSPRATQDNQRAQNQPGLAAWTPASIMDRIEQIYIRVRQNESHGDLDNTLDVLWIAMPGAFASRDNLRAVYTAFKTPLEGARTQHYKDRARERAARRPALSDADVPAPRQTAVPDVSHARPLARNATPSASNSRPTSSPSPVAPARTEQPSPNPAVVARLSPAVGATAIEAPRLSNPAENAAGTPPLPAIQPQPPSAAIQTASSAGSRTSTSPPAQTPAEAPSSSVRQSPSILIALSSLLDPKPRVSPAPPEQQLEPSPPFQPTGRRRSGRVTKPTVSYRDEGVEDADEDYHPPVASASGTSNVRQRSSSADEGASTPKRSKLAASKKGKAKGKAKGKTKGKAKVKAKVKAKGTGTLASLPIRTWDLRKPRPYPIPEDADRTPPDNGRHSEINPDTGKLKTSEQELKDWYRQEGVVCWNCAGSWNQDVKRAWKPLDSDSWTAWYKRFEFEGSAEIFCRPCVSRFYTVTRRETDTTAKPERYHPGLPVPVGLMAMNVLRIKVGKSPIWADEIKTYHAWVEAGRKGEWDGVKHGECAECDGSRGGVLLPIPKEEADPENMDVDEPSNADDDESPKSVDPACYL